MLIKTSCVFLGLFFIAVAEKDKCVHWHDRYVDPDGPSIVYGETASPHDGIGKQLSMYAFLWQLRRNYNVDVFISKVTHDTLARVFTQQTLSDLPILEEYFCNPHQIKFEYFTGPFEALASKKEYRVGRSLWLWPSTELLVSLSKNTGKVVSGDDYDTKFRGYKPDDHTDMAHHKLKNDYHKWMKRTLHFHPSLLDRVEETLDTIARKMDMKASSQVTFVGIHNRRSKESLDHFRKYEGKKPLKKSYFYDAMEEMRESYPHLAFLFVSDDMKWARANIKDRQNDLYFVGLGGGQLEDNDAFDFALLCHCNHSIITRGAFSYWVAQWTGGEYHTEYGSLVPNEVNDVISEEAAIVRKREKNSGSQESFLYASESGDVDGLLFPDLKLEGSEASKSEDDASSSSWFW